eukprot:scaffold32606_cov44-Phaeocystis_antarctica.AAC.2
MSVGSLVRLSARASPHAPLPADLETRPQPWPYPQPCPLPCPLPWTLGPGPLADPPSCRAPR